MLEKCSHGRLFNFIWGVLVFESVGWVVIGVAKGWSCRDSERARNGLLNVNDVKWLYICSYVEFFHK